ncbi:TANK-binding kinase 1-binding protein 1 isoform X2 [Corvus kubaryi]|uniref:TANK-binding kinase 1-binding protein 1 isoform X2 n=1 Tax=Corvus kubaryi TaxID=68294 RepID=UPI001C04EDB4|nr:TANK-binding kinase 1-binding protein 1 isoform X2 [Corvus kubaryi]
MDSMFEDDISILTQEALGPDEDWLDSPNTDLSGEMCSASHFALITAYDDIKNRLTGLERENSTLKRRLKMYEVKYPLIGEFGEEHIFSLYEAKETSLLKSEKASLQQQLNQFQHELQKSKEREEQLEEMIQAYEKLCVEKADLETELGEMRALVETHLSRIRSLEQQLRQRDGGAFPGLGTQDVPFITLHPNPGLSHVLERAGGWQSRGLEAPARLEAELEAARQENQRAQHREEHLKAECERLQAELKHLRDTREQEQSERDMAWVKKGEPGAGLHGADRGAVPPAEPQLPAEPDPAGAAAGKEPQRRPAPLPAVPVPLASPAAPLARPAMPLARSAGTLPVPISRPPTPLAGTPEPISGPAAPLASPRPLPVPCPAAPLPGATPQPVARPAAPLASAASTPLPVANLGVPAPPARREDGAGLRQTLEPPHQSRLPGPPQLLGGDQRGPVPAEPLALAPARSLHAPQAPALRRGLFGGRGGPAERPRAFRGARALREAVVGRGGVGAAQPAQPRGRGHPLRLLLRRLPRARRRRRAPGGGRLRPGRARPVLAFHQPAAGDGGLGGAELPAVPAGLPHRVPR